MLFDPMIGKKSTNRTSSGLGPGEHGIVEAAEFLCRAGSVDEVRPKSLV
jgi:hypothetical protein